MNRLGMWLGKRGLPPSLLSLGGCTLFLLLACVPSICAAEVVRLKATADIWLCDTNEDERNSSAGLADRVKLKSIQEMGAFRFDAGPVDGREVKKATLYLRRASEDTLRHIRVSTVAADWVEGKSDKSYGPASGATWYYADAAAKKPWAWPGSQFVDAIMGNGNTLTTWTECRKADDGWVAIDLTPQLVYALVAGDTDGLAVMEGGTMAFVNNFVYSCQSKENAPYIEVETGGSLAAVPDKPQVKAEPAGDRSHLDSGAIKVTMAEAKDVFCWKVMLNGRPVGRWQVKHPAGTGTTTFYLEDLKPAEKYALEVVAVAAGGKASQPAKVEVKSSPALSKDLALGKFQEPKARAEKAPQALGPVRVWAAPPLVKVDPVSGDAMSNDAGDKGDYRLANAVWDGKTIRLSGARGEYVSFQAVVENLVESPQTWGVSLGAMRGPQDFTIGYDNIEMYKNWYAHNKSKKWQPAYCVPMGKQPLTIPDASRGIDGQKNQAVYVDLYIPSKAPAGSYQGSVVVANIPPEKIVDGVRVDKKALELVVPVELTVYDFDLPDQLAFWPELNAYRIPKNAMAYYQLAQQHRCVANFWTQRPKLEGKGKDIKVVWDDYDRNVGPLLDGSAFKNSRRSSVPIECMYLPFEDSWPTPLSPDNYNYPAPWPGKGDSKDTLVKHILTAPYIGDALSQEYKDAFLAVQKQFIEHFQAKGWTRTEMQCFYGGKKSHRTDHGSNMWWTTDEPYHWDDWMSLEFFCRFWAQGRDKLGASRAQWKARGDISRPNWQDKILAGTIDTEYIGGFSSPGNYRRCRILEQDTGVKIMTYGGANPDTASNTQSVVMLMNIWLNGANGHLPWQTLGGDNSLDINDGGSFGGNSLMVPGERFGVPVVADMRLKAFRDGQQIIEYMAILAKKRNLTREQILAMVTDAVRMQAGRVAGAHADDADAMRFSSLKDWQISELRRTLAELIVKPE